MWTPTSGFRLRIWETMDGVCGGRRLGPPFPMDQSDTIGQRHDSKLRRKGSWFLRFSRDVRDHYFLLEENQCQSTEAHRKKHRPELWGGDMIADVKVQELRN